jgi:hypothetical protein
MRRAVVLALVVLLAGLASGCGSSGGNRRTTAAEAARAIHLWQTGLRGWSHQMLGALDGLSRLFSSPAAAAAIEGSQARTDARLTGFEAILDGCSAHIRQLGPPPLGLGLARLYALRACKNLERASTLIKAGVKQVQGGQGVDLLSDSTGPLSNGQAYVTLAATHLAVTPG